MSDKKFRAMSEICDLCGKPYGYHAVHLDECPTLDGRRFRPRGIRIPSDLKKTYDLCMTRNISFSGQIVAQLIERLGKFEA